MDRTITLVNVVNDGVLYRQTRMPALSLAYLSAYVPEGWGVKIVDETVETFDPYEHIEGSDIVGISGGNVCNVERIVDMLNGIQEHDELMGEDTSVVLGGYVGGLDIEDLGERVDSRVIGPGELAIQQLLKDFEVGELKREYKGIRVPMNQLKRPDFSGFDIANYGSNINWPVMTSVSCDNDCGFCSARVVYGDNYAARSSGNVLDDMGGFQEGQRVYFVDPNIVKFSRRGRRRARKLFEGMSDMGHSWFGSASFRISEYDHLLAAMRDSGCSGLLIGFDSVSPQSLERVSGSKYHVPSGKTLLSYFIDGVKKIQSYGIDVLGTFVIGFDTDDEQTLNDTITLVQDSGMKDAQYLPFTPLPGTPTYVQMEAAQRIFDHNFEHYDFTDVVFTPQNFSGADLRNGIIRMYEETFPRRLKVYRRMGVVRDRPELIKVESMRVRAERAERARERRGGGHH